LTIERFRIGGIGEFETHPHLSSKYIRKTFGNKTVLDGVSFDMAEGEVIALLAQAGAENLHYYF